MEAAVETARDVSLLSQGTPPLTELTSLWESAPASMQKNKTKQKKPEEIDQIGCEKMGHAQLINKIKSLEERQESSRRLKLKD